MRESRRAPQEFSKKVLEETQKIQRMLLLGGAILISIAIAIRIVIVFLWETTPS